MSPEQHQPADLGDRQGQVLSLVLAGKTDREIAEDLNMSLEAVSELLTRLERTAADTGCMNLAGHVAAARSTDVSAKPQALRVLLVDDHHINHLTIQAMLEDRNVEVITAFDGAEAVAKFKAGAFDRILMDIDMPIMDGVEAVRAIRTFERERGRETTPIAMFTALSGREMEAAAREAGADSYLTKPISLNQLYAFVGAGN